MCLSLSVQGTTFDYLCYYRPQRSWAKVIFLQASVILLTGGCVCLSACWDTHKHPPESRPPWEQTPPRADTPQNQTPRNQVPPWTKYTPLGLSTPPALSTQPPGPKYTPTGKQTPAYGQRVAGTHPTGMHSCIM